MSFLSHLHDGEHAAVLGTGILRFLSHLHDGELVCRTGLLCGNFLSHLHDGEPGGSVLKCLN